MVGSAPADAPWGAPGQIRWPAGFWPERQIPSVDGMDTNPGNRIRNTSRRRLTRPVTAGLTVAVAAAAMAAPAAAVALAAAPAHATTTSTTATVGATTSPVTTSTTATATTSAATRTPVGASHGGQLVSVTPLRTLPNRAAVTARLKADGFDPATDRYGVRTYRLVYRTVDAKGRPTTASGLLALPVNAPRDLTVVSFTHGTEVFRGDAPSMSPTGFEPGPAYTYASAGFAVSDPDYLGLGTGPGLYPWMDVPSETTAALDMLHASRAYVTSHGGALRRPVLISGFSQGASAGLGLGRALQDGADSWFRLGALAPISGAYDFGGRPAIRAERGTQKAQPQPPARRQARGAVHRVDAGRLQPRAPHRGHARPDRQGAVRAYHRGTVRRAPHRRPGHRRASQYDQRAAHPVRYESSAASLRWAGCRPEQRQPRVPGLDAGRTLCLTSAGANSA